MKVKLFEGNKKGKLLEGEEVITLILWILGFIILGLGVYYLVSRLFS